MLGSGWPGGDRLQFKIVMGQAPLRGNIWTKDLKWIDGLTVRYLGEEYLGKKKLQQMPQDSSSPHMLEEFWDTRMAEAE